MEFRTCPTCQASVLEDDVEDCPFCGASMSGKPAKKKPSQPAAGGAAAGTSQGKPTKKVARPAAPSAESTDGDDEDNPFGVDTTAKTKAIPLSRKPTQSRTVLVKCPMCETEGYISPSDAGKHVRCGNADCMVPVFRAPKAEVEETVTEAPPQEGMSPLIKFGVPLALVAFVGAGWFYYSAMNPAPVEAPPVDMGSIPTGNGGGPEEHNPENVGTPTEVVATKKGTAEFAGTFAKGAAALADERRPKKRSHEYARQLATEILADHGQVNAAVAELVQLETISKKSTYHQIGPHVELGWQAHTAGKTADAEKHAKAALELVKDPSVPKAVRRTLDAEVATIALLAELSLAGEALERLNIHQTSTPRGYLSMLWTAAIHGQTFDVEVEANAPWHIEAPCPVWIAVIETIVARGDASIAQSFCSQHPTVVGQEACLAAWAGRSVLVAEKGTVPEAVKSAIANAKTPSAKVRMLSAVAYAQLASGNGNGAKETLATAVTELANLGEAQPIPLPGMKEIYESKGKPHAGLPDPAIAQAKAFAAADVALVQFSMNDTQTAWATLQTALSWARVMAPSAAATQGLLDDCEKSSDTIKARLANVAPKGTSDFLAFNQYRRQCGSLHGEATARHQFQEGLLEAVALLGDLHDVWNYASSRSNEADKSQQEPYLDGERPRLLSVLLMQADVSDRQLADEIRKSREKPVTANTLDWLRSTLPGMTDSKEKYSEAAVAIRREQRTSDDGKAAPFKLEEILLRHFSQIQQQAAPGEFVELVEGIDATTNEDLLRLYGGWKGSHEEVEAVTKSIEASRTLDITLKLSFQRGVVDSLN
ncbi:MAG: hypothetical protein KDA66_08000 [Planctomycetaceae bacterium]|nr:hypothetical protein [Planctomycetaceae bacterium]